MKIQFCGAAGTVTGSCFLVMTQEEKFLIDCGMFQGSKELKEHNYSEFLFNPADIQFVLLTHAHIDHSGLIPKLYKHGFQGIVHTTKATKELCAVVLPDSGYIQEMEVERKNRKLARRGLPLLDPIYTVADAQECQRFIKGHMYEKEIVLSPHVRVRFQDAGHILGSAIIEVCIKEDGQEKKLVFSGDLGNINAPLIEDPAEIKKADYVIMESTYGNRYHIDTENKLDALARVVKNTHKRGGNLVIPSFAVERTQDLVYDLKHLKEEGQIPPMEIYIDSPMAVQATQVFINNPDYFDDEATYKMKGEDARAIFEGPDIHYILSVEESLALNKKKGGAIIISASGMADAGRIKHHLKHNLWRSECTVLFVGYQAEGTLGRRILDGEKKVAIHGEEVAVKAAIERIDGFSAHADQKGLLDWLSNFRTKPDRVFLVHGEEDSLLTLQRVICSELGFKTQIAGYGSVYDLSHDAVLTPFVAQAPAKYVAAFDTADAFKSIKEQILNLAKLPGKDMRALQRLMAQLSEIEREINKAV